MEVEEGRGMVGEVEGGWGQDLHLLVQVLATFPASSKLPILQPRKLRPGLMVERGYNFLRTTELEFNRGGIKPSLNSKLQALTERL